MKGGKAKAETRSAKLSLCFPQPVELREKIIVFRGSVEAALPRLNSLSKFYQALAKRFRGKESFD